MIYISMLSGGQDSTACTIKLLEEGKPLDYIVFVDTGLEFPMMYDYIDKLDEYIKRKFNMSITRLGQPDRFDFFCFGKFTKGERKGIVRGLPMTLGMQYCTRELKVNPFEKWVKGKGDFRTYIGYTYSELKRAQAKDEKQIYPLIEAKTKEEEVSQFLKDRNIWNELYKHFSRTGCFLCPKQKKEAYFMLWKHYKKEWAVMHEYEKKCRELNAFNQTFFIDKTLFDLEKEFIEKDKQGSLFTFEEDPMLSCFCGT